MIPASRREIFAWAMYDFANSGYTTVVLTAVFNAYFVGVVAAGAGDGRDALLWTLATSIANALVLLTAPVIGAMADHGAHKKRYLAVTTAGCVLSTAALATVGAGDIVPGITLLVLSAFFFHTGEDLIAGFLPEIARPSDMGRVSAYGWSLGYLGGLGVLGLCLGYLHLAAQRGVATETAVPGTMLITAAAFALAALPTFLWLRERAVPLPLRRGQTILAAGWARVRETFTHLRRHRDLFRFLIALALYYSGIYAVIVLAAVYAQKAMNFTTTDTLLLILVVNLTAAAGALAFGWFQDRLGSQRTLVLTLLLWIAAVLLAWAAEGRALFWLAANLVGIAMGASQSAGRALVGLFSPKARTAEFFGLWGVAGKFAAVIGPPVYGLTVYLTRGDHRQALLAITVFFIAGLLVLLTVNERRGRRAARAS
jgi:UMF1 family MFS transporter